jgi:hypothetical protein
MRVVRDVMRHAVCAQIMGPTPSSHFHVLVNGTPPSEHREYAQAHRAQAKSFMEMNAEVIGQLVGCSVAPAIQQYIKWMSKAAGRGECG